MNAKTAFLNGNIEEVVYMNQLEGFPIEGKGHMVCKLKESIYRLKQASKDNGILSSMVSIPLSILKRI